MHDMIDGDVADGVQRHAAHQRVVRVLGDRDAAVALHERKPFVPSFEPTRQDHPTTRAP
ncbi:MAG: hypothetical protein ABIR79_22815 [Candidatus Binatia bacterium]